MTTEERIQMIEEAMDLITQAQELVDDAVSGTSQESHYDAYGKYGFSQLLKNGNPYDNGLQDLIDAFLEEGEEE